MPSASDKMLGRLAVDNGWITRDQLEHALAEQLADGDLSPLGDVLVSLGYVTPERAARLLEMQAYVDGRQEGKRLGTLAVANGLLTEDQVAAALDHQAAAWRDGRKAVRLGDACVALGFLSPADLPRLLKTQNRVNRSSAAAPAPPPLPGANESQARRPSAGALPPRGSAGAIRRVSSGALSPAAGASGVRRQGGPAPAPAPTRAPTSRPVSDRHAPAPAGRADRGRRSSTTGGQAGRRGARAGGTPFEQFVAEHKPALAVGGAVAGMLLILLILALSRGGGGSRPAPSTTTTVATPSLSDRLNGSAGVSSGGRSGASSARPGALGEPASSGKGGGAAADPAAERKAMLAKQTEEKMLAEGKVLVDGKWLPALEASQQKERARVKAAGIDWAREVFNINEARIALIRAISEGEVATGTGFLVSDNGLVITNAHVIAGADQIECAFSRKVGGSGTQTGPAEVRMYDPDVDIALLKVSRFFPNVGVAGRKEQHKVATGDRVCVIGNPGGLEHTITEGLVSHSDRQEENRHFIQISAAVNPGNSGGPLFDSEGSIIGVVTLKANNLEGTGYALPAAEIERVLRDHQARYKNATLYAHQGGWYTQADLEKRGLAVYGGAIFTKAELEQLIKQVSYVAYAGKISDAADACFAMAHLVEGRADIETFKSLLDQANAGHAAALPQLTPEEKKLASFLQLEAALKKYNEAHAFWVKVNGAAAANKDEEVKKMKPDLDKTLSQGHDLSLGLLLLLRQHK